MEIKLTKDQAAKYETIRWLLADGPHGQGKSLLMALAFIDRAIDSPGLWVEIFDHRRNYRATRSLIDNIKIIFDDSKEYRLQIKISTSEIRVVKNGN